MRRGVSVTAQDRWVKNNPQPVQTAVVIPYRPIIAEMEKPQGPQRFTHYLIHTIGRGMVFGGRRNAPSASVFQLEASTTARKHGISVAELIGQSRCAKFVRARQELCYLMSKKHGWSLPSIGNRVGNRDHTTVLHAIRRHTARLANGQA